VGGLARPKSAKRRSFGQALLYITELIATQLRGPAPCGGIASKISGEEAIEAFPLSRRAVL